MTKVRLKSDQNSKLFKFEQNLEKISFKIILRSNQQSDRTLALVALVLLRSLNCNYGLENLNKNWRVIRF